MLLFLFISSLTNLQSNPISFPCSKSQKEKYITSQRFFLVLGRKLSTG
uniref:Uncharacterized protein n=1 Tax=Rhizophora mucronata TaxID=61149 RepID=A0A2P2R0H1_RHIMU